MDVRGARSLSNATGKRSRRKCQFSNEFSTRLYNQAFDASQLVRTSGFTLGHGELGAEKGAATSSERLLGMKGRNCWTVTAATGGEVPVPDLVFSNFTMLLPQ